MTENPKTTHANDQLIRILRGMIIDSLHCASSIAIRAQEAAEGTSETFLFDEVRREIFSFIENSPAMRALASAAVKGMK